MTYPNFFRGWHYRKHVIHLPISETEYYEILDHVKPFRGWIGRVYTEMPDLFPDGFKYGFHFKNNTFSLLYGIRLRSIQLHAPAKGLFVILPSFVKVDPNQDSCPKDYTPAEVIRFVLECENRRDSLRESDFRHKHQGYYRSAVKVFGSWALALETAGFSTRKAKSLCKRKVA